MFLLWNHIADFFMQIENNVLHILPKLTFEHIKLTLYSINAKLGAQVLSSSVCKVLSTYCLPEAADTIEFCLLMD